jgi:hypothetical protein
MISICVDVVAAAGTANLVKDSKGGAKLGTTWDQLSGCRCCVAVLLVLVRWEEAGASTTNFLEQ